MKNVINFAMLSLVSHLAAAQVEVAVIDTGVMKETAVPLCPRSGNPFNYTSSPTPLDEKGHGEYVAQALVKSAGERVCIESHKVFAKRDKIQGFVQALLNIGPKVKVVNISIEPGSTPFRGEYEAFKALLGRGVRVVLSAGNDPGIRLSAPCNLYPHCYAFPTHVAKRWFIVGSNMKYPSYTTGELVNAWAAPWWGKRWHRRWGTSFAAPRVSGQLARRILREESN